MFRTFVTPLAILALVACASDPTGGGSNTTGLSFSTVNPSAAQQVGATAAARDITVIGGGSTLIITRAQLVLEEVELETVQDADCDNSGPGNDPTCHELELGPFLVDLPLSAELRTQFAVTIPPGTYREIEFDLEAADDDSGPEAVFLAANPGFRRISVRVEGTINGRTFVFTSGLEAELERDLEPPLVIGADGGNVTIFVDVASWFQAPGGGVIDPLAANLDAALRATVEANIRASFEAFDDDDRDGRRDRG